MRGLAGAALALLGAPVMMGANVAAAHPAAAAAANPVAPPAGLTIDRLVLLMRHGVRPPTKAPPMPAGITPDAWPAWPVNPGWLTPHGAAAIARLGTSDGATLRDQRLLPATGCPAPGTVIAFADSDQRTIASADAWLAALAPGCGLTSHHQAQDADDPLFSPKDTIFDPARSAAALGEAIGPGGIVAVERRYRPLLAQIDAILCGNPATPAATCGVSATPTGVTAAAGHKSAKLTGALDRASTAAQILLLEYAEGKPMAEVGWGRATPGEVTALSAFHALEFRLLARPPYIASVKLAGLLPVIRRGLDGAEAITLILGHDTNVAALGGLLGVHWQVPGLAEDDPAPGGAIMLQRLHDSAGNHYVRALYRSQTLDQMRGAAASPPYVAVMPIPGCAALGVAGLCNAAAFAAKLATTG